MRKITRRVIGLVLALTLLAAEAALVGAAELPQVEVQQDGTITAEDTGLGDGFVYGIVQPSKTRSMVAEEGVRLRSGPSTSYPVLELMYTGERVIIDRKTSAQVSGWYYLKRLKTGTWGWANASYILS